MSLSHSIPADLASPPTEKIRHGIQTVAQRASLSQQEAAKRVAEVYAQTQARVRAAQAAALDAATPAL